VGFLSVAGRSDRVGHWVDLAVPFFEFLVPRLLAIAHRTSVGSVRPARRLAVLRNWQVGQAVK